ncbi:hypothetical protein GCM10010319_65750 [Streptomyces blastmyceticus]|uniref:Uncharacterized protein n=1 Tax=Streptomyces blastmyceticus TaxID=68180 RepID=A0ABP3HSY1_9ACTN
MLHAHQGTLNLTNGGNVENLWAHLEDTASNAVEGRQIYFVDDGATSSAPPAPTATPPCTAPLSMPASTCCSS